LDGETGEVLWSRHYASDDGLNEAALSVAHDSQNNAYITGRGELAGQGSQMLTMKLAAGDGHIIWIDHQGGDAGLNDIAWDVVVGPDDHPVVTGYVIDDGGAAMCLTRKLSHVDGDQIWFRQVPGALDNDTVRSSWLVLMDDGDVVMCQRSWGNGYDTILQRYEAADGGIVWETVYDGPTGGGDDPKDMARDAAGNLLVAGVQDIDFNYNYMVLKFDQEDGSLIWEADGYDGPGGGWWDVATCIAEGPTGSGTVIVSGLSDGSSTGTSWDMTTVAYAADLGDELWVHRWDGPAGTSDEVRDLAVTDLGDVYVTGYGYDDISGKDMVSLRLDVSSTSAVGEIPGAVASVQAWPNPFNPRVNFLFELSRAADIRLRICDLRGREVAVLLNERLERGAHQTHWDGRGSDGRAVASGVYLAIFENGQASSSRKIVLAK
jgi:hypothetical protein